MLEKDNSLVTVFSLCYNTNASFVISAIDSIYNQTYSNIEHIIINDAPDDFTHWPIIREYLSRNNLPSTIIENKTNQGICNNLNRVLDLSRGKYLIGCSDDVLEGDAIRIMVSHYKKLDNDVKIVFGDVSIINEENIITHESYLKAKGYYSNIEEVNFSSYLQNRVRFPTLGCLYKKDVFDKVGNYDNNLIAEDVDMHLRILSIFRCSFCGYKVANYRSHSFQLSQKSQDWFERDRLIIFKKWHGKISSDDTYYVKKRIESMALNALLNRKFDYVRYHGYGSARVELYRYFSSFYPLIALLIGVNRQLKFLKSKLLN
jgi:alpha-1,3-rhamnosyltransferase